MVHNEFESKTLDFMLVVTNFMGEHKAFYEDIKKTLSEVKDNTKNLCERIKNLEETNLVKEKIRERDVNILKYVISIIGAFVTVKTILQLFGIG